MTRILNYFELVEIVKNYLLPLGEIEDFVQKSVIFFFKNKIVQYCIIQKAPWLMFAKRYPMPLKLSE